MVEFSEGVKIRAQIDQESTRSVLLVNGGGSVALLALLPVVIEHASLVRAILIGLSCWLLGLFLAVVHSILRRKCSRIYEQFDWKPPAGKLSLPFAKREWKLGEPTVCSCSWGCLYVSVGLFLVGGLAVVVGGWMHADDLGAGGRVDRVIIQDRAHGP